MNALEVVGTAAGAFLAVAAVLAILWRVVVLPNLREQLFKPIDETHKQVTVNHHATSPPTMLDRLDDLIMTVDAMALTQSALLRGAAKTQRLEAKLADHLAASDLEARKIWLVLHSLIHEEQATQKGTRHGEPSDQGGPASLEEQDTDL